MQENTKKFLSFLLAVVMLVSMMPISVYAQEQDITVQSEDAMILGENFFEIPEADQEVTRTFIPEESGTYYFYSQSDLDTFACLYDQYGNPMTEDDENGYANNFDIECYLTAGEVYTLGVKSWTPYTGTLSVFVEAEPVLESITFTPVTVAENTNGYVAGGYNEETGEDEPEYFYYSTWDLLRNSTYTATLSNGEVLTGNDTGIDYNNRRYYFGCELEQSAQNPLTAGNTYYITVSVLNQTVKLEVNIVTRADLYEKLELGENAFPAPQNYEPTYMSFVPQQTGYYSFISLTEDEDIYIAATLYDRNMEPIAYGEDSSFCICEELIADEPYIFCINQYTGDGETIPVYLEAVPALESLTFNPITVVEYTNGDYHHDYIEETDSWSDGYYYYEPSRLLDNTTFTASFADGTVITGSGDAIVYNGHRYAMAYELEQSVSAPFEAGGDYVMTVSVLGQIVEVPVSVVTAEDAYAQMGLGENIFSIPQEGEAAYMYFTPERTGYYYFSYQSEDEETFIEAGLYDRKMETIAYTNGFSFSFDRELTEGETYVFAILQYSGSDEIIPIYVESAPIIESISFTPITVLENTDGDYTKDYDWETDTYSEEYYRYYTGNLMDSSTYTIVLEDGTELSGNSTGFEYNNRWYDFEYSLEQSADAPLTVGNTYYMSVSVLGKTVEVPVSIITLEDAYEKMELGENSFVVSQPDETVEKIFIPTQSGIYSFYSLADVDTYAELYDRDINLIADNDDGGTDNNFCITYELTAGEIYILSVKYYSSDTGTLPVYVEAAPVVESVAFTPIKVAEYTNGEYTQDYDMDTGNYSDEYYRYYERDLLNTSTYTIVLDDGTEITGKDGKFEYNNIQYEFDYYLEQSASAPLTVDNTYYMTVRVLGKAVEVPVSIVSIVDLYEPLSMGENAFPVSQEGEETYMAFTPSQTGYYNIYTPYNEDIYADAWLYNQNMECINSYGGNEISFCKELTAGETYILGIRKSWGMDETIPVYIEAAPVVESVAFTPITVVENTKGEYTQDYDEQTDTYSDEYYSYYTGMLLCSSSYTIIFEDGTELSGSNTGFAHNDRWYEFECSLEQSASAPLTVGNTYYMTVRVLGQMVQVPVSIVTLEDAYEKMELGENAFPVSQEGEETYMAFTPSQTGYYNIYTPYNEGIYVDAWLYDQNMESIDNNGGNSISFCKELTAGETYILGIRKSWGMDETIPVYIEAAPIIESITFDTIKVVENTHGEYTQDYDEQTGTYSEEYFSYWPWELRDMCVFAITLDDGTQITGSGSGFEHNSRWYQFDYALEQSAANPLTLGNTYYMSISVLGQTVQVPVSIVTIEDAYEKMELGENSFVVSQADEEVEKVFVPAQSGIYWFYSQSTEDPRACLYDQNMNELANNDDGGENNNFFIAYNLTAGEAYILSARYCDSSKTGTIPVHVEKSPIESISFAPISVVEYTNGSYQQEYDWETGAYKEYYLYDGWRMLGNSTYTVNLTDGTVINSSGTSFSYGGRIYNFSYYLEQSASAPLTAGNTYEMTVSVMGCSATVPVTVAPTPVKSITFDPIILEEGKSGWDYGGYYKYDWLEALTYTITFRDGTQKQGSYYEPVSYNGNVYSLHKYSDDQSWETPWLADNTYTAKAFFNNQEYPVYVTIVPSTEDNSFKYIIQDGKVIITDCTSKSEILEIPETIEGYPVVGITSLGNGAKYALEIRIPDSVTTLGNNFLFGADNYYMGGKLPLKKLVIGSGIRSVPAQILDRVWALEEIEVSKNNPYLTCIDGVVYDKNVTQMILFPVVRETAHQVPDSVTDINVFLEYGSVTFNIITGAGLNGYIVENGIIYNSDKTRIVKATANAPAEYEMPDSIVGIDSYAFSGSKITSITLAPTVTDVTYNAFAGAVTLEEINVPSDVTVIGTAGFDNCTNLKRVNISDLNAWCHIDFWENPLGAAHDLYLNGQLVKDLVIPETVTGTIYDNVFAGGSFESVTIPAGIQRIRWNAFGGCENLNRVNITDLGAWTNIEFYDEQSNPLTYARNLYLNGNKIEHLVLPESAGEDSGFYTIKPYAFCNIDIQSLTVPASVYSIGEFAFYGSSLPAVTLPDSLGYLSGYAFAECYNLKSVDLGAGITSIPECGFYNSGLETLTLPQQIRYVGDQAFANSQLKEVTFQGEQIVVFYGAFKNCPLDDLDLEGVVYTDWHSFDNVNSTQINLGDTVTEISYRQFASCKNLISVTIPDSVEFIYPNAFEGDKHLSHVLYTGTQEQWDELYVESEELLQATLHCNAVGDEVSTYQTCTTVTYYCSICEQSETFRKAKGAHNFEDGVCTICGHVGYWDYESDEAAGTAIITGYNGTDPDVVVPDTIEGLRVIGITEDLFSYNRTITSVIMPDTITQIPAGAFKHCTSLEGVLLGNSLTEIPQEAFAHCYSLVAVNLPDTITSIGDDAFYGCSLSQMEGTSFNEEFDNDLYGTLEIPAKVTEIGYNAFFRTNIEEIFIPDTVTSIAYMALDTYGLNTLAFGGDRPDMGDIGNMGSVSIFYPSNNKTWNDLPEDGNKWYACDVPEITKQPVCSAVESGKDVTLSVKANGQRLRYQWYFAAPGETEFVPVGGNSNELTVVVDKSTAGGSVYCQITDVVGQSVKTTTLTLETLQALTITKQPTNASAAIGKQAKTTVTATGIGLKYAWYYKDPGMASYKKSATTGKSYVLEMVAEKSGRQVYCVVTDQYGNKVTTDTVTLTAKVAITEQPNGASAAIGKQAKVTVTATGIGLKYQWFYKDLSAASFAKSSQKGKTYSITMAAANSGREVYCVITDQYGNEVTTDTVTLTVKAAITKQPADVSAAIGKQVTTTVTATGVGLEYQWYYKDIDADSFIEASVTEKSYSMDMTAANSGREVYCVITDQYGNEVTTDTVTLTAKVEITDQPNDASAVIGKQAKVTVTATGIGLKYQWFYKDSGAASFAKSSQTGKTYSVAVSATNSGREAYCVITDKYGNKVTTDTVTLTAKATITAQPSNASAAIGKQAKVTVTATGIGLKYQWFYKDLSAASFAKSSQKGKTYSITMAAANSGREVYCVITDQYGNEVTTDTVTLTVKAAITKQPADVSAAIGKQVTTTVTATGVGLEYQWYYKDVDADSFIEASVTEKSYSMDMTAANSGREVYCVITDQYGNEVTTDTVTLTAKVEITDQPNDASAVIGKQAKVTVTATGIGLKYQWFYKDSGAASFAKSSQTGKTYSIAVSATNSGREAYCVITDQYGNKVTTDTVTLTAKVAITEQPNDASVAIGKQAKTTVTATGIGLKYQWFYKDLSAASFAKSSQTGKTYSITMAADNSGREAYCVITDKYGNKVTTDTVTLTAKATITAQPSNASAAIGKQAKTTVTATGIGLKYQWFYKDLSAESFAKSSQTGKTYSITVSAANSGREVYCVITDQYGNEVTTNTVTLTAKVAITTQPVSVAVSKGATAKVTVKANGDGLTYKWYYKDKSATKYTLSTNKTSTFSCAMTAAKNGRLVYCVVSDQYGNTVQSNTVTLSIK